MTGFLPWWIAPVAFVLAFVTMGLAFGQDRKAAFDQLGERYIAEKDKARG